MEITSKNNQLIKDLKHKKAKNRFLLFLDTPNLVKEALEHNLPLKHLLVEKDKNFDFLPKKLQNKVIFVSKEVLNSLVSVVSSAGILGVFELNQKSYQAPKRNFLVLDNVQDAGNVGTLLRSALGANFKNVYLLDCASISNEKVVRASSGALFGLDIFELTREEFCSKFMGNNLFVADMNGQNIFNAKIDKPLGIVLGNEGSGVSQELKNLAQNKAISVPMQNGLESLNVAVSGSIIMYHINFGG